MALEMAPADPTVDVNIQLTKLAHSMLSGKYLIAALENDDKANAITSTSNKQESAPPRMFKAVIAASHPEFSSMRQQVYESMETTIFFYFMKFMKCSVQAI